MSKLFNKYEQLKKENSEKLYLLKSGIFYIGINKDAEKLASLFDFKITNLNDTVIKCGFPEKRLEYYTNLLKNCSVDFEIVDSNYEKIKNYSDYLDKENIKEIINTINNLDMEKINTESAFNILLDLKNKVSNLY